MLDWMQHLDTALFFFINQTLGNPFSDVLMPFITGRYALFATLLVIVIAVKDRGKTFTIIALGLASVLLADALCGGLKYLFHRPRPCSALEGVRLLVGCGKTFSLPSGHATNSFAFATPFLIMSRSPFRYVLGALAALVCISRVAVGVHYPFDIAAGTLLGVTSASAVVALYRWAERRWATKPATSALFLFLLAISLFRIYYILDGPLDLSADEAHYWEWSRRLDLSYYSKGPMIAYLIRFGTSLFGDNVFGVRVLAVIFSALTSVVIYKTGRAVFNDEAGAWAAAVYQGIPLFATYGVVFTIDSPFMFFWALSLYLFWKAAAEQPSGEGDTPPPPQSSPSSCVHVVVTPPPSPVAYWLLLGIVVGFGLLTKYTMAFFWVCAFIFLAGSRRGRSILKSPLPYASAALSALIFLPVVVWNGRHAWVTLRHTAGQAHVAEGLRISPMSLIEFLGSQLGVLTPVLAVLMVIALIQIHGKNEKRFLLSFSAPIIAFFILKSLQGKVQANWAMMGYVAALIAFAGVFMTPWSKSWTGRRALVAIGLILSLTVTAAAHYPSKFDMPQKLDPTARLRGWRQLGTSVTSIMEEHGHRKGVFIFSDSYQLASLLAFYVKDQPITYCINMGRRMNQYDLWPGPESLLTRDGIFVTIGDQDLPGRVGDAFTTCEKKTLKIEEKGRLLRAFTVFVCSDFRGMPQEPARSY